MEEREKQRQKEEEEERLLRSRCMRGGHKLLKKREREGKGKLRVHVVCLTI